MQDTYDSVKGNFPLHGLKSYMLHHICILLQFKQTGFPDAYSNRFTTLFQILPHGSQSSPLSLGFPLSLCDV